MTGPAEPSSSRKRLCIVRTYSSDSNPVNKRPKYEGYEKHARFWADDGNVLIQIGETRFSLHRSRLRNESTWFHTLLDSEGEEESPSKHDAMLQVKVEKDEGKSVYFIDSTGVELIDFEALLSAMDDGM